MKNGIEKKLREALSEDGVRSGKDMGSILFRPAAAEVRTIVCSPSGLHDVVEIVRICREEKAPIFTSTDSYFPAGIASREGALVEFSRMARIERIDRKNLYAHVQRGVTFEQLTTELRKLGLRLMCPASATTDSVVESGINRAVMLGCARWPETQFSNLMVVLPDGRIHKTGSHALSEDAGDWKDEAGPHISKWYHASGDIFGIVVRATVQVFPVYESRRALAFGFADPDALLSFLKEVARKEVCEECLGGNARYFSRRLKRKTTSPWVAVVAFHAFTRLVEYQAGTVEKIAAEKGGKPLGWDGVEKDLDRPWPQLTPFAVSFHTLFRHVPFFSRIVDDAVKEHKYPADETGVFFVVTGFGRAIFCEYDFYAGGAGSEGLTNSLIPLLVGKGAFFDRPLGRAAEEVYSRAQGYLRMMRKIKEMVDPERMLNPGFPVPL